ncbi:MAG: alpha/beta hydrolase [Eggerthellaceae bacterium]|nr:alpha/beta hydrolase [Eggerthellaceae bacterium]
MAQGKPAVAKRILIAAVIVLAALACAAAWWVNDCYHADSEALAVVADANGTSDGVTVQELSDGAIAFVPENPKAGFIFYPGAKVQPEAYAPLMLQCAERGILCVIVRPPFNLAILDPNAANGIQGQFPSVSVWAIGGHSMGGVAASDYASKHLSAFDAIVYLASYPATDLTAFEGAVLSIAGTNDQVLNHDSYESAADVLPADTAYISIEGGNHSYFGNYGDQAGDGIASISRSEQQRQTADLIAQIGTR